MGIDGPPDATAVPDELAAWKSVMIGSAILHAALEAELQQSHQIGLDDLLILMLLSESVDKRLRMTELASLSVMPKSRLTYRVDHLVTRGLAAREPCLDDRRGSFARITDRGSTLFARAGITHLRGVREHLLSMAGDDEVRVVVTVFDRVLAGLSYGGSSMMANPR